MSAGSILNPRNLRLKTFSSQVAWTFAVRVLMIFNSVVAGVIVARWLGAEGIGQLAVINVAVATIVQLGSFGLPSSNTYFIAQDQARFRSAAINSLIFALAIGSVLAIALSALASVRADWFGFVFGRPRTIVSPCANCSGGLGPPCPNDFGGQVSIQRQRRGIMNSLGQRPRDP